MAFITTEFLSMEQKNFFSVVITLFGNANFIQIEFLS